MIKKSLQIFFSFDVLCINSWVKTSSTSILGDELIRSFNCVQLFKLLSQLVIILKDCMHNLSRFACLSFPFAIVDAKTGFEIILEWTNLHWQYFCSKTDKGYWISIFSNRVGKYKTGSFGRFVLIFFLRILKTCVSSLDCFKIWLISTPSIFGGDIFNSVCTLFFILIPDTVTIKFITKFYFQFEN